jgi:glycosyltransferase involved in cell wall biosynthesis
MAARVRRMKVGIGVFAPAPSGLSVATVDTALGLRAAGVGVTLFADPAAELPEYAESLAPDVVRLAPLARPLRRRVLSDLAFLPTRLAWSRRWARALEANHVDVVHGFSPGAAALLPRRLPLAVQAWFNPPRLVPRMRTMLRFAPRTPPVYAARALVEAESHAADLLGYRRADVVLVNTPTAERAFAERGFRTECVPPSIQVPRELPVREPSEALRIAFCAHPLDRPRKGLRYLLEALTLVRGGPLELTLVGGTSPALDEQLEALRRASVGVTLLGHVPRERYLEQLAARTDLLAFMSLYEEWGYALFEALSRGVPALAFDLYPFHDIIDADTGLLVPPGDPRALAGALERALTGALPEPRAVLDSTMARFGNETVIERLLEVYRGIAR